MQHLDSVLKHHFAWEDEGQGFGFLFKVSCLRARHHQLDTDPFLSHIPSYSFGFYSCHHSRAFLLSPVKCSFRRKFISKAHNEIIIYTNKPQQTKGNFLKEVKKGLLLPRHTLIKTKPYPCRFAQNI